MKPETCRVYRCKNPAEIRWEPGMGKHGLTVPVCWYHFKRRLWWFKGWVYDRDEERQS